MTTIFVAASGSGGHLFPAVYIATALNNKQPQCTIIGIGSGRPLEKKIFTDWNVHYEVIPTVGIKNRGVSGLLQFIISIPKAVFRTAQLFRRFRPDAVVGAGGYATVFPILAAWCLGIPTWIHEAELKPGLANALLCFFSNKVSLAFETAQLPTKSNRVFTGHPVRAGLESAVKHSPRLNPPQNLLILGGSQGARGLDEALPKLAELIKEKKVSIRHQCRAQSVEEVRQNYRDQGIEADVVSFIDKMTESFLWSDIIISRSGAGSVMELGVINVPCILVPFPHSQGDHQTSNAKTLVDSGKAILIQELDQEFVKKLELALRRLLDVENYNEMLLKPGRSRGMSASQQIASGVFSLIHG